MRDFHVFEIVQMLSYKLYKLCIASHIKISSYFSQTFPEQPAIFVLHFMGIFYSYERAR